jgi:hypothetical protein
MKVRYVVMGAEFEVDIPKKDKKQIELKLPKANRPGSRFMGMATPLDDQRMASFIAFPDGRLYLRVTALDPVNDDNEPWPDVDS